MKAKFGAIVVAGSGKIGGHVASRNRGGAYIRTKVTPINPQSAAQLTVRNRLGSRSQAWRGLTQAQRDAWNAAVGDFARTDIFGDLKNPSGFNLYGRLNNNILTVGGAAIVLPPVVGAVASVGVTSIIPAAGTSLIPMVLTGAVPALTAVKVFATAPQSAGKSFVKSEYRLITTLPAATATPVALGAPYVTKFGAWTVGQKLFFKIVFVSTVSGLETVPTQVAAISAA
jgi:hypothetical protein